MPAQSTLIGVVDPPTAFPTPNSTTSIARTIDLQNDVIVPVQTLADKIAVTAKLEQEPIAQALDAAITYATGIERSPVIQTAGPVVSSDYAGQLWSVSRGVVDTRATGTGPSIAPTPSGIVIERAADVIAPPPVAIAPLTIESSEIKPARKVPWALVAAVAAAGAFLLLRKR